MSKPFTSFPKIVHAVPDPLGLYLRPGHNDHRTLSNLLATGNKSFSGAVLDPTKFERHSELREQILDSNLDAILDPRTLRSATAGGFTPAMGNLPWGVGRQHTYEDFRSVSGKRLIGEMASFACANGFTQVMAPTHFINGLDDPWLAVDIDSACQLRTYLDREGGANIPLIYPLSISYKMFRNPGDRIDLVDKLSQLPINSIWFSISGVGRGSTATAAKNYIDASRDFHSLQIPLVADHMGGAFGLSLMAFGSVGGIAHGFMQHETFNISGLSKPQSKSNFGRSRQVYVPAIDAMLSEKEAEILLTSRRGKAFYGCNDSKCCPRGVKDMMQYHMRHFLCQRIQEVAGLSRVPETLRPQQFLEQHLRPATDKALAATQIDWADEKIEKKMQKNRKHLDTLRIALGDYAEKTPPRSFSLHPKMRMARGG